MSSGSSAHGVVDCRINGSIELFVVLASAPQHV